MTPALRVEQLSKSFALPRHTFQSGRLEALRDVSFEVKRGEFFSVVGHNGSGKSTLLRCLSGIYPGDNGSIDVDGSLAPFIELGVGFNAEMTAWQNAFVNSVLLGKSRAEARAGLDEIFAFAELERFADMKLKNCSTGMVARLGFAVTVQVDADILLFDEVLAVGDRAFQAKCIERFEQLKADGRTIVLVTHEMDWVRQFSDRALLLRRGQVDQIGPPDEIAAAYEELTERDQDVSAEARAAGPRRGKPHAGASTGGLGRVGAITWTLALAEFRLRYSDSALSYVWTIARPLAAFGVLLLVFTNVGGFDAGVEHYPLYLLFALVLWTYFSQASGTSVGCLVRRTPLLRRLPVPHVAFPLAVTLTALFDLGMTLVAVFVFVFASGVEPRLTWLELPLIVALLTLLVAGVSMLLSALYVRLRDIEEIWVVLRQALFYCSPIFYVAAMYPESVQEVALFNPLAAAFTEVRFAMIDPQAPTAAEAIGGAALLLVPIGIVLLVFGVGLAVFQRLSGHAAERL